MGATQQEIRTLRGHDQGTGASQARRPKPALVMPRFGPSDWMLGGCWGRPGQAIQQRAQQKQARQGLQMTCRRARKCVAVLLSATTIAAPMAVQAQAKGQSDRAVTLLMDFAWNTIPRQFRRAEWRSDHHRSHQEERDHGAPGEGQADRDGRRPLGQGAVLQPAGGAERQLPEHDAAGRSPRSRWTKQQLVFITLLHATTVAYLTGTMRVTVRGRRRGRHGDRYQGTGVDRAVHGPAARGHQVAGHWPISTRFRPFRPPRTTTAAHARRARFGHDDQIAGAVRPRAH